MGTIYMYTWMLLTVWRWNYHWYCWLTWMNWIVRADFPTPPPPTTTSLYSVKSFEAAIAPAIHSQHTHILTWPHPNCETDPSRQLGPYTQPIYSLTLIKLLYTSNVLYAPALITAVILSAGLPFHSVTQWPIYHRPGAILHCWPIQLVGTPATRLQRNLVYSVHVSILTERPLYVSGSSDAALPQCLWHFKQHCPSVQLRRVTTSGAIFITIIFDTKNRTPRPTTPTPWHGIFTDAQSKHVHN